MSPCLRFFSKSKTYTIQDKLPAGTTPQNGTAGRKPHNLHRPQSFLPPGTETKPQEPEKPQVEEPKLEEPEPEIPKIEEPEPEIPKIEEPEPEISKIEEPEPEIPKIEEPEPEIPKTEEPEPEPPQIIPDININDHPADPDDTQSIDTHIETESIASRSSINNEPPVEIRIEEERRPGVVPLSVNFDENGVDDVEKHPKTPEDDQLIRTAIENSDFLNKIIKGTLIKEVVDAMYNREIKSNEIVIKEGEKGSHMYVSAQGKYEVSVKGKGVVNTFEDIRIFGEMAILYNDKRNATIKALTAGRVWVLDRSIYQKLMVRSNIKEQDEMLAFLENVKTLNKVGTEVMRKVTALLKVKYFAPGTTIIRQGDKGDKFYIIRAGTVTITREGEGVVGNFGKGKYFGELALLKEDVRQATVTADSPGGVECLTLKRQHFFDHFGELREDGLLTVPILGPKISEVIKEHQDVQLNDLKIITTLGVGGFGRVELVQHKDKNLIFALKYLKKVDMVEQNQQEHVYNERNIQLDCRSKFIIRLYHSYMDKKYIYFLMEPCLGGDLWTLLQRQKIRRFEEKDARFIAACVLEAFTYLHERGIVYRDLKPENLLIDEHGYIKLTDFGFAKKLGSRGRTFTFAGTPEYVAPEIILSRGHDKAVDYWAFGIFIFELLTGKTPFRTNDASHMRTYNKILTGIDAIDFPTYVTAKARNIVEKLCKAIPTERLGCQRNGVKDIKNHRWFLGFDWIKLNEGKLSAPFRPRLKSNTDTRYFEAFKKDNDIPPDVPEGWDHF